MSLVNLSDPAQELLNHLIDLVVHLKVVRVIHHGNLTILIIRLEKDTPQISLVTLMLQVDKHLDIPTDQASQRKTTTTNHPAA